VCGGGRRGEGVCGSARTSVERKEEGCVVVEGPLKEKDASWGVCVLLNQQGCVVVQGPLKEKLLCKDLLCLLVPGLVEEKDMSH
jgi:hypothetical protein